jgi:hypothetical protein
MEIEAQPSWLANLSPTAINSLSSNNSRINTGFSEVLMNPALKDIDDVEIHMALTAILDSVHVTPKLREIEQSNQLKFGPRSVSVDWESRKDSLFAYFKHEDYDPGEFDTVGGNLRPISLRNASDELIRSSTSGLPYLRKKGLVLDEAVRDYSHLEHVYPCVLYTRTQELTKTRNIWGYPIADTLMEQTFFHSYLNLEKRMFHRAALLGPDQVDVSVSKLLSNKSTSDVVVGVDFSSYDATVKPEYSFAAFRKIASEFQSLHHEDLYRLFRRFITIPIYTPDGEVSGPHGVPSGSTYTNTIDSEVQLQIASVDETTCQVQGDDGIYIMPSGEQDSLYRRFDDAGLKINTDKSELFEGHEAVYLQRYYHPDYKISSWVLGGVYSIFRALARIKYLERWTDFEKMQISGDDFFALRTITILENCKHHPGFEAVVKYVQRLDKNGLAFSRQGLAAYSKAEASRTRAAQFNTADLTKGIDYFETMKVLKSV